MFTKLLSILVCLLFISSIQSASIVDIIGPADDSYGSSNGCGQRIYQVIVNSAVPVEVAEVNGVVYVTKSLVNGTTSVHDVYISFPNVGRNDQSLTLVDGAGNAQIFPNIITYYCLTTPTYTLATDGSWVRTFGSIYYMWYKFISLNGLAKPADYTALKCSVPAPFYCTIQHYQTVSTSYYFLISMYMTNENVAYSLPVSVEIANSYGTNKLIFPFNEIPAGPSTISNIQIYPASNTLVSTDVMADVHFFYNAANLNVLPAINGGLTHKVDMNIPVSGNPSSATYFAMETVPFSVPATPISFYLESITKTGITNLSPQNHIITFTAPAQLPWEDNTDPSISGAEITELGPGFKLYSMKSKTNTYHGNVYTEVANYSAPFENTYPYGITNGNVKEFYQTCSQFVGKYGSTDPFASSCGTHRFSGLENPLATVDDVSPSVTNVEVFDLDAEKVLIRIYANDEISGIQRFELQGANDAVITNRDLVKGTKMNGVYEYIATFLGYSVNSPKFLALDAKTNILKLDTNTAILNTETRQRIPRFPIFDFIESNNLQTFEFTFFQFKYNDVDLSTAGVDNTLSFNITNANPSFVPRALFIPSLLNALEPGVYSVLDNFIEGVWNPTTKLYEIDFTLPPRIFTGKVSYMIVLSPNAWSSEMIESVYGVQSQLRVISSNADAMPPVASAYAAYPSTSVNVVADTQIGWTITIQDLVNGLKSATFNITSDYDWEPYTIKVTPADAVSGDKYTGVYNIRIPVSANCRSQIFKISSMVMTDTSGHSSFYPSKIQLNSLYKFINSDQHNININCAASTDITPPILTSLTMDKNTIDIGQVEQNRAVTFTFIVTDLESGVSPRHTPYVYLETPTIQIKLSSKSSLVSVSADGKSATFTSTITLPYGFAAYQSMVVSIFGLVDKQLNINGYTALDLKNLAFPFLLKTTYSSIPIVTKASRITSLGGVLTVYGHKFGLAPLKTVFQVDYQNGQGWKNTTTTFQAGIVLITNAIQPTSTPFYVRVIVDDNIISNSYLVTPIVSTPPAGNACGLLVQQTVVAQWYNSQIYPFTQVAVTYQNTGTKPITGVSFAMSNIDQIWGVDSVNGRYKLPSWFPTIAPGQFYSFGYIIKSNAVGTLIPTVTCP